MWDEEEIYRKRSGFHINFLFKVNIIPTNKRHYFKYQAFVDEYLFTKSVFKQI